MPLGAVRTMAQVRIEPTLVVQTVARLRQRIEERFPGAGLGRVCASLMEVASRSEQHANWLGSPVYWLRGCAFMLIAGMLVTLVGPLFLVEWKAPTSSISELVQAMEAAVNELVLLAAGIYFMFSLEGRYKRHRGMQLLQELRSLAHVIDMHQLTKDPERVSEKVYQATPSSPATVMDGFLLRRYLDYCSEMLALIGKVAASYVRDFQDPSMVGAVNEVESLTADLSRKVWQKIMILHSFENAGEGDPPAAKTERDAPG